MLIFPILMFLIFVFCYFYQTYDNARKSKNQQSYKVTTQGNRKKEQNEERKRKTDNRHYFPTIPHRSNDSAKHNNK